MSTKRQQILAKIKEIVLTVSVIKAVEVNKTSVIDLETIALPCAFIYSSSCIKIGDDRAVIGYENWEWLIDCEVCSDERNDQEDLLGLIHAAMVSDYTLSGLAVTSDLISSDLFVLDPTRAISSMVLNFSVLYRHKKGVP